MNEDERSPFSPSRLSTFRSQYAPQSFDRNALLKDEYLLASEGRYRVYYAGLGAIPAREARIVFVGLTPGLFPDAGSRTHVCRCTGQCTNDEGAYSKLMRHRVAFAGTMRQNLCSMLDAMNFPTAFGIERSIELFDESRDDVAATSALVYPVFVAPDLRNFSGAGVDLGSISLFRRMIEELLGPRLGRAPNSLIVPLGVGSGSGVRYLCETGRVAAERVLLGMPHPSGSNGHRKRQFQENAAQMRARLESWFAQ